MSLLGWCKQYIANPVKNYVISPVQRYILSPAKNILVHLVIYQTIAGIIGVFGGRGFFGNLYANKYITALLLNTLQLFLGRSETAANVNDRPDDIDTSFWNVFFAAVLDGCTIISVAILRSEKAYALLIKIGDHMVTFFVSESEQSITILSSPVLQTIESPDLEEQDIDEDEEEANATNISIMRIWLADIIALLAKISCTLNIPITLIYSYGSIKTTLQQATNNDIAIQVVDCDLNLSFLINYLAFNYKNGLANSDKLRNLIIARGIDLTGCTIYITNQKLVESSLPITKKHVCLVSLATPLHVFYIDNQHKARKIDINATAYFLEHLALAVEMDINVLKQTDLYKVNSREQRQQIVELTKACLKLDTGKATKTGVVLSLNAIGTWFLVYYGSSLVLPKTPVLGDLFNTPTTLDYACAFSATVSATSLSVTSPIGLYNNWGKNPRLDPPTSTYAYIGKTISVTAKGDALASAIGTLTSIARTLEKKGVDPYAFLVLLFSLPFAWSAFQQTYSFANLKALEELYDKKRMEIEKAAKRSVPRQKSAPNLHDSYHNGLTNGHTVFSSAVVQQQRTYGATMNGATHNDEDVATRPKSAPGVDGM